MKPFRILFSLIIFLSISTVAFAQQDCGVTDCPGRCGRFVDQNGDGFCDHGLLSAPAAPSTTETSTETPSAAEPTREPKTTTPSHNDAPSDKARGTRQGNGREPQRHQEPTSEHSDLAKSADTTLVEITEMPAAEQIPAVEKKTSEEKPQPAKNKSPYSLILISALTIGLYIVTFILVKTQIMKKITHRKIWNVALLITGLVSCLLGFFLVIQINYNLKMEWLWTVKYYHVQFGIAMTIIAIIHILWHTNYWKSLFKNKKKELKNE